MKRCPQCEFVYEDEQTRCDMDGNQLIFDSRPLPKLQALSNAPDLSPAKSLWRGRLVPATAGLVLATVLGLVYFVSTQRQTPVRVMPAAQTQPSMTSQPVGEQPKLDTAINPDESLKPAAAPADKGSDKTADEEGAKQAETPKRETTSETTKKKRPANLNKPQPQPVKPASGEEKPKNDSKVSAILKKTGRLIKKPFKL